MDEREMAELLRTLLTDESSCTSTKLFEDSGLLTDNEGVIARFEGGAEFQITVVQSAGYKPDPDEDEDE